jgi:hypothetical protein
MWRKGTRVEDTQETVQEYQRTSLLDILYTGNINITYLGINVMRQI